MENRRLNTTVTEMKTSRSGRVLIPRLRCWLGERAVINNGEVEITDDGYPDLTSTFQSERTILLNKAQVLGCYINRQQATKKVKNEIRNMSSKRVFSPSTTTRPTKPPKRTKVSRKSDSPIAVAKTPEMKSPDKKLAQQRDRTPKRIRVSRKSNSPTSVAKTPEKRRPDEKLAQQHDQTPKRTRVSRKSVSPIAVAKTPEKRIPDKKSAQQRDQTPKRTRVSTKSNSPTSVAKTPEKRDPDKKSAQQRDQTPKRTRVSRKSDSPIAVAKTPEKRIPDKKLAQQHDQVKRDDVLIDIWAPEFQPYVLLRRLLPEDLLAICNQEEPKTSSKKNRKQTAERSRTVKKTPEKKATVKKIPEKKATVKSRRTRTIKETQQMLRILHNNEAADSIEDEAAATEGYFQKSPSKAMTMVAAAMDILNDDFGDSEDNLSIQTLSEREFSPVSFAVSPVGSVHETDNEIVSDDMLLRGSPCLSDPSSFQRAALLHRTVADRDKLVRKTRKQNRKGNEEATTSLPNPLSAGRVLQPRVMKALEKDMKKKCKSSKPWDFSAYFRGNLLHVSVNSDSDTSEDSIDSINIEF